MRDIFIGISVMTCRSFAIFCVLSIILAGQTPDLNRIIDRLDQMEKENQRLKQDIEKLRKEVTDLRAAGAVPRLEEKVEVQQQRIEEQAQTKVEAAQKFPLKLSGLVLMNAYLYAGRTGGDELPMVGRPGSSQQTGGGTFRQSQIALNYSGSTGVLGAKITGRLQLDFFAGSLNIQNHLARIRTANIAMNWTNRSLTFAVDKPIISPREPASFSQLGLSPLANSGNLWLWQPQLRYEERINFSDRTGLIGRVGVYQTNETLNGLPATTALSRSRPAAQGRLELFHVVGADRRIELAGGFHRSESLVAGTSIASYAGAVDWLVPIAPRLDWTGFLFTGQNLAGLGLGGLRQGITIRPNEILGVHSRGGWTQTELRISNHVKFHLLGGIHDDRNRDLPIDGIGRNLSYGGNFHFLLAPNLILGLEALQIRTNYRQSGLRLVNRYDVALGYLF